MQHIDHVGRVWPIRAAEIWLVLIVVMVTLALAVAAAGAQASGAPGEFTGPTAGHSICVAGMSAGPCS
jgi:hypothetical protein